MEIDDRQQPSQQFLLINLILNTIQMFNKSRSPSKSPSKTPKKSAEFARTNRYNYASPNASFSSQIKDSLYYCHYNNAIYMGGIKSFQRHGRGIVLHDDGSSIISEYHYDLRHGHNIIIKEHCILSIIYNKNRLSQAVMRVPNYMLYLRYGIIHNYGMINECPDGKGVLVDYQSRNIIYLSHRKGQLVDKRMEEENVILNKVFELDNIDILIGTEHANAINLDFKKDELITSVKSGNKLNFGYYKRGLINGLGVTLVTKDSSNAFNVDTHRQVDTFFVKNVERGFFINSQLSGMGQKYFKNGNMYIGDFKGDVFEGRGILKNSLKQNWVLGYFEEGNMRQLLDYSNEQDDKKCGKLILGMHQRKNTWINKDIEVIDPQVFYQQISKILNNNPKEKIKNLEQKKMEVLRRIQENFMCDNQNENPLSSSRDLDTLSHNDETKDAEFKGFAQKFIPKEHSTHKKQPQDRSYLKQSYYSPEANSSPNQSVEVNSTLKNYRHAPLFERTSKPSDYEIKIHQIPMTKDSSDRYHKNQIYLRPQSNTQSISPVKKLSESNNRKGQIYSTLDGRPEQKERQYSNENINKIMTMDHYNNRQSRRHKGSSIGNESPTFNLDSKRIISRSRIFKYLNNEQSSQDPPKFVLTQDH